MKQARVLDMVRRRNGTRFTDMQKLIVGINGLKWGEQVEQLDHRRLRRDIDDKKAPVELVDFNDYYTMRRRRYRGYWCVQLLKVLERYCTKVDGLWYFTGFYWRGRYVSACGRYSFKSWRKFRRKAGAKEDDEAGGPVRRGLQEATSNGPGRGEAAPG